MNSTTKPVPRATSRLGERRRMAKTSPSTAATMAPRMLSRPPRMIAAKTASAAEASSGDRPAELAISTPATVPTTPDSTQVRRCE